MPHRRHPIQCILPPYISDQIIDQAEIPLSESLDNDFRNITQFKGKLKKIVSKMEDDLKV